MTLGYVATLRNSQLDAITTAVGSAGKLAIYDGTRPATGGTATNKLAEFTMGSPFAAAASGGVLSPTLPANVTALLTGTATWYRITTSAAAFVMDGSVSATGGGGDLQLNSTAISSGATVSITAHTITAGNP
jgi:hypothetical protein